MSTGNCTTSTGWGVSARVRRFLPYVVGLGFPVLLVWALFGGYVCDDDLIMLRYAERLADGRGLTWNDGEYAHAVTAGLLVVVAVLFRWAGSSMELGASLLSLAGTLGSASLLVVAARRAGLGRWYSACLGGALVLAAPFAVWSFAGVGGVVFAAVAGWAVFLATDSHDGVRSVRRLAAIAALLVLLQLVRPDALVVAVPVLLLLVLRRPSRRRAALIVALPVLVFAGALFALQAWYFRTPVPHVAMVKVSPDLRLLRVGLLYVLEFVRGFGPLLLLASWFLYRSRSALRSVAVTGPLFVAASWTGYLVWVGGDWMPGNRHFAVVLLLLVVVLLRLPDIGVLRATTGGSRVALRVLLLPAVLLSAALSLTSPATDRARDAQKWMDECVAGSVALREVFEDLDPLLAVEPAGCPPYVTGFRSLDMLGLLDVTISRAAPAGRPVTWDEWQQARNSRTGVRGTGTFIPGHGNGDGVYVWEREPDLIVTCDPVNTVVTGCFRSWSEMASRFDVASRYRTLAVDVGSDALWKVWVRHDGGRTGVRYDVPGSSQVTVPSWLLGGPDAPLRRGTSETFSPTLRAGGSVELPPVRLTAGDWVVEGLAPGVALELGFSATSAVPVCAEVRGRSSEGLQAVASPVVTVGSAGCVVALRLVSPAEAVLSDVVFRSAP